MYSDLCDCDSCSQENAGKSRGCRIVEGIRQWWWAGLYCAISMAVILPVMPGVMRETDQASVVRGAYDLAFRGVSPFASSMYHYDKMYGSYLVLAAVDKLLPHIDPVTSANCFQFFLWLLATGLLLLRAKKVNSISRLLLFATLLSPVWLLNVPFFSPAAISSYALVLAFCVRPQKSRGILIEALLVGLATSFRSDAILILPFLVWMKCPRMPLLNLCRQPRSIALGASSTAALLIGHFVHVGSDIFGTPLRIIPKIVLAFAVFGLGPVIITFAIVILVFASHSLARRHRVWYVAGFLACMPPIAYYLPQLLSPRYLLLTVTLTACALSTRRFSRLRSIALPSRSTKMTALLAITISIVPLIVGLQLPRMTSPSLVFRHPTTYPTADGHWPMGGLIAFTFGSRDDRRVEIDHNQAIWYSALTTSFLTCDGRIPMLSTPMVPYLELAADLRALNILRVNGISDSTCGFVYADLRSLTHSWMHPFEGDGSPDSVPPLRIASSTLTNEPIVIAGLEGDLELQEMLRQWRSRFANREFEIMLTRQEVFPAMPGLEYSMLSRSRFTAEVSCSWPLSKQQLPVEEHGGFNVASHVTTRPGCLIRAPQNVLVARTVLMSYMALH